MNSTNSCIRHTVSFYFSDKGVQPSDKAKRFKMMSLENDIQDLVSFWPITDRA